MDQGLRNMDPIDARTTVNDPKFWRPLAGSHAQHADTTNCRYREVLKYSGNIKLQSREDVMSGALLENWLTKV